MKIKYRGPDDTKMLQVTPNLFFGFHRLAINGLDELSNQPLILDGVYLMCNGEIFNFHALQLEYGFHYATHSDCEVILHLYHKFGFEKTLSLLDGVFAILLYDSKQQKLYVGNDPIGIRPLYWGKKSTGEGSGLYFSSEPIAIADCDIIDFFRPGSWISLEIGGTDGDLQHPFVYRVGSCFKYDFLPSITLETHTLEEIYQRLRLLLTQAVEKRLMSDRPIASLLSGGLDSSLVSALIAQELRKSGKDLERASKLTPEIKVQQDLLKGKLHTFSIGLPGSPDLKYAKMVADHIGSVHHHVEVSESDFLQAIPEVIRAIQSWDITTVRASVGNYLIAKYIKKKTDFTVIFNGDVSEEINASYYYSRFAPSPEAFFQDNVKLLREVHQYDVLRSARCVEHHSLESRTPFADKALVAFVMSLDPKLKMVGPEYQPIEKALFRNAFKDTGLLPEEILWRPKEAFSDGVSDKKRSWHTVLQEWAESQVSDEEFQRGKEKYSYHCPPSSKEAYFYRRTFEDILPGHARMIKEYWMPRFVPGVMDPSARVIQKII